VILLDAVILGPDQRSGNMSAGGPEWLSVTIVDVVQWSENGPRRARCQIGLVRMPETGDVQLASQVVGTQLLIFPPYSAAQMIGALRDGLSSL
jgi:hypothetical protein